MPVPSAYVEVPLPTSVEVAQARPCQGSAEAPGTGHAEGQVQGVGGAEPPAQKKPRGHSKPLGEVDPAPQANPGAAVQGPEQEALDNPGAAP